MLKKKKLEEKKPQHKINWYEDKYQSVLVWRNWLFTLTLASIAGIIVVCGALYIMLPLKSVSPFVIQIDEKSGISEMVENKSVREYSANEMLLKYFVMQYISARENYDIDTFKTNSEIVHAMSSDDVYRTFLELISPDNPESPINKYSFKVNRLVDLMNFTVLDKDSSGSSQVQARIRIRETSNFQVEKYAIVTLSCYFEDNLQLDEKQRLINPLGFIVTAYIVAIDNQGGVK